MWFGCSSPRIGSYTYGTNMSRIDRSVCLPLLTELHLDFSWHLEFEKRPEKFIRTCFRCGRRRQINTALSQNVINPFTSVSLHSIDIKLQENEFITNTNSISFHLNGHNFQFCLTPSGFSKIHLNSPETQYLHAFPPTFHYVDDQLAN